MTQFVNTPIAFNAPSFFGILPNRNIDKIPVGATSVNVANIEHFTTHNTGAITITEFAKGVRGQEIVLLGDGFTTVQENATIVTGVGDISLAVGSLYRFINFDNVWYYECCSGGGTYTLPLIIEGAVPADKIAYFHNTDATGYGVRFQNDGPVTNYTIKVSDASGVETQQIFGDGLMIYGIPQPYAGGYTFRRPPYGVSRQYFSINNGGDVGGEIFIANQSTTNATGQNTQWGGQASLTWTQFGGWDSGARFGQNGYYDNTGNLRAFDPLKAITYCGFAGDGSWTYNWMPAPTSGFYADTTTPTSNNPYTLAAGDSPYYAGQVIVLDGGAYFSRTASILAQRKEWPLQFGVTPDRATDLPGIIALKIRAGVGDNDRIELFINGALRNVKSKTFATLAAGDNVLYY